MIEKYLSMYLWTSFERPVYPGYSTNFAILAAAAIAGVIAGSLRLVRSGGDIGASIATGFFMGAAVFIAWSLTREADPDHNAAAFVSAGAAFVLSILWNVPPLDLLVLGAIIVFLRLIDRIVGPPFHWLDTIGSFAFVLILAWQQQWLLVLFMGIAYMIDAVWEPTPLRRHILFALVSGMVALYAMSQQTLQTLALSTENMIVLGTCLLIFLIFIFTLSQLRTKADTPGYSLNLGRIRATDVWLLLLGIGFMLFAGDAGVRMLVPLWGVFAGPPLYALGTWIDARVAKRRLVTQ